MDHGDDQEAFRKDLYNIACTTLSSKILVASKEKFSNLAVDAVLRLKVCASHCIPHVLKHLAQKSGNLEAIQIIKKLGGSLLDSYLDEGFLLDKKVGVNQVCVIQMFNYGPH